MPMNASATMTFMSVVSKDTARLKRPATALALLCLTAVICVALGRWQLERAQTRRDLHQSITQGRAAPALQLVPESPAHALHDWRAVQVRGTWRHDLTVLIENRNQGGKPGYWVATPLQLGSAHAAQPALLVLRGWIPRQFDRQLPTIPAPKGLQNIHGQLRSHVPRLFELPTLWGKARNTLPTSPSGPIPVVTNLAPQDYAQYGALPFLPVILQQWSLPETETDGMIRAWEDPSLDADKNTAYAMQWFSFAAIALGAALWLAWRLWSGRLMKKE